MIRRLTYILGLGVLAMLLGGCAAMRHSASSPVIQEIARYYMIGVTYDKAVIASRDNNRRSLRSSLNSLQALRAHEIPATLQLPHAEDLVREAGSLSMRAQQLEVKNPAKSEQLLSEAAQKYRSALHWAPDFPSKNPLLLNSLGYFLAEHGQSAQDFEQAALLTRRALQILDNAGSENQSLGVFRMQQQLVAQKANTRDSYAWALYKLHKYDQAENEQEQALQEAKRARFKDAEGLSVLWEHMAKILEAQGRTSEAQSAMKKSKSYAQR